MDTTSRIVGSLWILTALLILALSRPLVKRRVKRNPWYGVRFRASFASERAWADINEHGGRQLARWSLAMLAAGVALVFVPMEGNDARAIALTVAPTVFVLVPAWRSWRFARRYEAGD